MEHGCDTVVIKEEAQEFEIQAPKVNKKRKRSQDKVAEDMRVKVSVVYISNK